MPTTPSRSLYLIGSLRNTAIPEIGKRLREEAGLDVFDDWWGAGPQADDCWKDYEEKRGRTYRDAIYGHAARNVFYFDLLHLQRCHAAMLVMPAGKSAHLELGWLLGKGREGYVIWPNGEPAKDRWDVMYQFASGLFFSVEEAITYFKETA